MSDFRIGLASSPPKPPRWGHVGHKQAVTGELKVSLVEDLKEVAGAEYRIGKREWAAMEFDEDKHAYESSLDRSESYSKQPLQVRLRKRQSDDETHYIGPFSFPIQIAQVLRDDQDRIVDRLITEARQEQAFENSDGRWYVPDDYSAKYSPVVKDILCGTDSQEPLKSLPALAKTLRNRISDEAPFSLQYCFARTGTGLRDATHLWVQLKFIDDSVHGPIRYSKPLTKEARRQRDVAAWKSQNGIRGDLATFKHNRFQLTGLRKVAAQFTHIEAVGKYHRYTGSDFQKGYPRGRSHDATASMSFEVNPATLGQQFPASPTWHEILIRGHTSDGEMTPIFRINNSAFACGTGIDPLQTTSNLPPAPLYLFLVHNLEPSQTYGIARFLSDPREVSRPSLQRCERSRIELMAIRSVGTAKVELFADKDFTKRKTYASPGLVYARYSDRNGRTVGYSVYTLSKFLIREWAEHGLSHIEAMEANRNAQAPAS